MSFLVGFEVKCRMSLALAGSPAYFSVRVNEKAGRETDPPAFVVFFRIENSQSSYRYFRTELPDRQAVEFAGFIFCPKNHGF
jgi:hypothetical protein